MNEAKELVKVMYEEVSDIKDLANEYNANGETEKAAEMLKLADARLAKAIVLEKQITEREIKEIEAIQRGADREFKEKELVQQEKRDKQKNILEWAGIGVSILTALSTGIVAVVVSKNNTNALTNVVAQSWQAQTTGEVPAALTKELTSQVIRECGKVKK